MSNIPSNFLDQRIPSIAELFFFQELASIAGPEVSLQWLSKQCVSKRSCKSLSGRSTPCAGSERSSTPSTQGIDESTKSSVGRDDHPGSRMKLQCSRSLSQPNIFRRKEAWHQIKSMSKSCSSANIGLLYTDAAHKVLDEDF